MIKQAAQHPDTKRQGILGAFHESGLSTDPGLKAWSLQFGEVKMLEVRRVSCGCRVCATI